ncbi:MAG: hypothetical protein JSV16_11355, partial [Candidatus Hydrogenedentota bacterium]
RIFGRKLHSARVKNTGVSKPNPKKPAFGPFRMAKVSDETVHSAGIVPKTGLTLKVKIDRHG